MRHEASTFNHMCSVQLGKAAWPSPLAREMTEMALRAVHPQDEASRQPLLACCILTVASFCILQDPHTDKHTHIYQVLQRRLQKAPLTTKLIKHPLNLEVVNIPDLKIFDEY